MFARSTAGETTNPGFPQNSFSRPFVSRSCTTCWLFKEGVDNQDTEQQCIILDLNYEKVTETEP